MHKTARVRFILGIFIFIVMIVPFVAHAHTAYEVEVYYGKDWVNDKKLIFINQEAFLTGTLYLVDDPDRLTGAKCLSVEIYNEDDKRKLTIIKNITDIPPQGKTYCRLGLFTHGNCKVKVIAEGCGFSGELTTDM